jgi:hypothetical protein
LGMHWGGRVKFGGGLAKVISSPVDQLACGVRYDLILR